MLRHGSGCLVVVWCRDQGFGSRQGRSCERSRGWSRHRFEVATWPVEIRCPDLDLAWRPGLGKVWGSQVVTWILMSRPRPSTVGQFGVATWSFEIETWGRLSGRVATSARPACARHAHAVRAYAVCA